MSVSAQVLVAPAILVDDERLVLDGGLLCVGGAVRRVLPSPAAVRRAARSARLVDAGDVLLSPGLVNAHAHLELSGLAGRMPRGGAFGPWVARLLALRAERGRRGLERDARAGALRALGRGTTLLGDVDTSGGSERGLTRPPLRLTLFRELLDANDPARTRAALARVARALPARDRLGEGLCAHAPYSASPPLLARLGRLVRSRRAPFSTHWSETAAELAWLADGSGPLASMLGTSPRRSGLDLLEDAGLLGPSTTLVHGNLPARGEPARLARHGVTLVHCPGSHAWFERPDFPLQRYLRAGVRLALGTDSLASNEDLDMAREMALARARHPQLSAARTWRMATLAGARALGFEGRAGALAPGAWADVVAWSSAARTRARALEELTTGNAGCERVWIGGRSAPMPAGEA